MTETQLKKLKELRKHFKPHQKAFIMAALPYMTVEEIAKTLGKSKTKVQEYIDILKEDHIKQRIKQMFAESRLQKWMEGDLPGFKTSKKKRWGNKRNVIGIRKDLGIFLRSKMEANLARVLTLKYGRNAWEYEPEIFDVGLIRGKKKNYLPDFHVTLKDGTEFWIEVKGRFFSGDISKMRAFLKKYPNHKVVMMTCRNSKKVKQFAEKQKLEIWIYEDLRDDHSKDIPEWE
jgi:DNA-binding Lrp family transcriptional regulator